MSKWKKLLPSEKQRKKCKPKNATRQFASRNIWMKWNANETLVMQIDNCHWMFSVDVYNFDLHSICCLHYFHSYLCAKNFKFSLLTFCADFPRSVHYNYCGKRCDFIAWNRQRVVWCDSRRTKIHVILFATCNKVVSIWTRVLLLFPKCNGLGFFFSLILSFVLV